MAKIWYVREGSRPNNCVEGPEINLEAAIGLCCANSVKYLGAQPPEFPTNDETLTSVRDPKYSANPGTLY